MRGDTSPGRTASWAASRAVMQPQTCKPRCAPDLITQGPDGLRPITNFERSRIALTPIIQRLQTVIAGASAGFSQVLKVDWVRQMSEMLGIGLGQQQRQVLV